MAPSAPGGSEQRQPGEDQRPPGENRRLHVAWGAVGPFGKRRFLTLEPSGTCAVETRDLQDPTFRDTRRFDCGPDVVRAIWQAADEADFIERTEATEAVDGDFIEVAIETADKTTATLLRNGYHRPTLVFIGTLNSLLPPDAQVAYSLLDPAVIEVLVTSR
jgi:hypothetical protein